jgi:hypothetical protein
MGDLLVPRVERSNLGERCRDGNAPLAPVADVVAHAPGLRPVAERRRPAEDGRTFDDKWSLPVPRTAHAIAAFTLFTLFAMPGVVLALLVAVGPRARRSHTDPTP